MGDVVGTAVLLGEDGLPIRGAHLWLEAGDKKIAFQLYKTSEKGEVGRSEGGSILPQGKRRAFVRSSEAVAGRTDATSLTGDEAAAAAEDAGRPKAFLKVAGNAASLLADAKPDALGLLRDAKAAGLLTKLDAYAEKA